MAEYLGRAQLFNLLTLIAITIVGCVVFALARIVGNLVMQNAIVYYLGGYIGFIQIPWFAVLQYIAIKQQGEETG